MSDTLVHAFRGSQAAASVDIIKTITDDVQRRSVQTAFASSMREMWIMYTCIAAIGLMAAPFVKQTLLSKEHTETRTGIEQMTKRVIT